MSRKKRKKKKKRGSGGIVGRIYNKSSKTVLSDDYELADSFFTRARGLMFRCSIRKPLLFVFDGGRAKKGRACAIHSLFVFFSFSAIFLDARKRVVDVHVGRPFISFIVPAKECAYLIEGEPELAGKATVGDVLEF